MEAPPVEQAPEPARPSGDARATLPWIFVVAVLAGGAYANGFRAPFTLDDLPNIVEMPAVHLVRLDLPSLARATSGFPSNRWLARLSFALNYYAGGTDPLGYHAVNVLFHVGAAVLAFFLAIEVLARVRGDREGGRWAAALAAALFAVHPVQTQAVTYIVQRMTSMGTFFGFAALLLYLRARSASGRRRTVAGGGALLVAYLAFACKETFVVLPVLAGVLEAFLFPGLWGRLRENAGRVVAGAGAIAAIGGVLLYSYWPVIETEQARFGIPLSERLLSQGRILAHYVSLLALPLPSRLHVDYDWPPSRGLLDPPSTLPALIAVAVVVLGAVKLRRRRPLFSFAVFWFCGALLVEQTILPIDLVFEHRLYFASLGPFVFVASEIERLSSTVAFARWAAAAPIVAALAWGTHLRNEVWSDPLRLYADSGAQRSEARTLLTLAEEQRRAGHLAEAQATLQKALALEPGNVGIYVNLGMVAWTAGDAAAAERWYRAAIEVRPIAEAWYDLGWLLAETGREAEAEAALMSALAVDPRYVRAHLNLANAAARKGDLARARALLDEALRIDPGYVLARQNRARIAAQEGRFSEAIDDAAEAARLAPGNADAQVLVGDVLRAAGRLEEAARAYDRALALDGGNRRAAAGRAAIGR